MVGNENPAEALEKTLSSTRFGSLYGDSLLGEKPSSGESTTMHADPDGHRRFRTIWISDVHLGTKGCQAELLLEFLKETECEQLFLVGDIVDGWRLKRSWYWPQAHNDVVQKLLRKARK